MQGPSHLVISWFIAEASGLDKARDRRIVAWSGLAPDFDVVAYLGALVWYGFDKEAAFENVWKVVHHRYTHNLAFVLAVGVVAYGLARGDARSRLSVAALALLACGLHNFLDLAGGGPTWPIYPLFGDRADRWIIEILQRGGVASSGRLRLAIWAAVPLAAVAIPAPLGFNPFR